MACRKVLLLVAASCELFGDCVALNRLEASDAWTRRGDSFKVKDGMYQGTQNAPGGQRLTLSIFENLKDMGSRRPAPVEQWMRGRTTSAPKGAASMLESAELTFRSLPKASSSSKHYTSTAVLLSTLAMLVFVLCIAAPVQKGSDPESCVHLLRLLFYVCTWMALSAGLTIFNKWMFLPSGGDFPHVATLTWCHMLASTILTRILQFVQPGLFPAVTKGEISRWQLMRLVLPVAALQPFTLVLGNTAYLYLSVSYIQMIKTAMPGMVFIISALFGMESFSIQESLLLVILGLGVAGCSHGELEFSWIGLAYQLSSFFCEALRVICLKLMVSQGGSGSLDPLSALFYVAPLNFVALTGPMLHEMYKIEYAQMYDIRYALGANCLAAFGLNIAGVCLMSMASAVTFTVCGLLKDFGLVIGSTVIFGNLLTSEEITGAVIVVGAGAMFQRSQRQKHRMK